MTTPDQHKIDQGRQRTLDERLAGKWWGCGPATTRNPHTGARRTTFERASRAELPLMELYVEAYNAAMDDARRLINPPAGLEPVAKPGLAARSPEARRAIPADGRGVRRTQPAGGGRQRPARAGKSDARLAAEALFKGGNGNG